MGALMTLIMSIALLLLFRHHHLPPDSYENDGVVQKAWSESKDRNMSTYVQPAKVTTIHTPKGVCSNPEAKKNSLFLLIVVNSAFSNFASRRKIRQTWASSFNKPPEIKMKALYDTHWKLVFILGLPPEREKNVRVKIAEEIFKYEDIILEDFIDTYYNLSIKSTMMLKWVTNNCRDSVRYILKTDDNIIISIKKLIIRLLITAIEFDASIESPEELQKKEYKLIGDVVCFHQAERNHSNKWYCPKYMYEKALYPCYLDGKGYLMSAPTALALYDAALKTPLFHFEDIYITGLCRKNTSPQITAARESIMNFIINKNTNNEKKRSKIALKPYSEIIVEEIYGWKRDSDRNTSVYIQPNKVTTIVEPKNVCSDANAAKNSLWLLIVVNSAVLNFDARKVIRFTWGYQAENSVVKTKERNEDDVKGFRTDYKVIFNLGLPEKILESETQTKLDKEIEAYGDILQEDFLDTYYNLSIKSTMMLKWVTNKCGDSVRYILKSDDDVSIDIQKLFLKLHDKAIIHENSVINDLLYGWLSSNWMKHNGNAEEYELSGKECVSCKPNKTFTCKWYCPSYMYPHEVYPTFLMGSSGYLFSAPTARALYKAALVTPLFHLEDVYITGLCREAAGEEINKKHEVYATPGVTYGVKTINYKPKIDMFGDFL